MLNEQEMIQREMERTRGSLTEKLEALEGQVADTVSSTAGVVHDTTQTVQETVTGAVDAVKETVSAVTDKVQETVQSVSDIFNLRLQMERHPWIVLGGAVAVGYIVGSSFHSMSESEVAPAKGSGAPPPPPPWNGGTQYAQKNQTTESTEPGIWSGAVSRLKDLGVSYLMGMVRDLARNELPEAIASRVAEEVDALTAKFGVEPIAGPVLPKAEAADSQCDKNLETRPGYQEKKASGYRGRTTATVP